MAVTIKSADVQGVIPFDFGTRDEAVPVDVEAGELLVLGLFGGGVINSVDSGLVNVNGLGDLEPIATGNDDSRLWVFNVLAEAPITEVVFNVTDMYASIGRVVAQGNSNLRIANVDGSAIQQVANPGDTISSPTVNASSGGYQLAIGGGAIYLPF